MAAYYGRARVTQTSPIACRGARATNLLAGSLVPPMQTRRECHPCAAGTSSPHRWWLPTSFSGFAFALGYAWRLALARSVYSSVASYHQWRLARGARFTTLLAGSLVPPRQTRPGGSCHPCAAGSSSPHRWCYRRVFRVLPLLWDTLGGSRWRARFTRQ